MAKLIVCTGTLSSGGAERVLSLLSNAFCNHFKSVDFVMWLDNEHPDIFYPLDKRVNVIKISHAAKSTSIIAQMRWFRRYVKHSRPCVVLSFMAMINLSTIVSLLGMKVPIYCSERNDPRYFHHGKALRGLLTYLYKQRNVRQLVVQTINNKAYFPKKLQSKISVIFNPLQLSKDDVGTALRTEKQKQIVSVGRLEKQKHQHILVKAFADFVKKHSDFRLVIYGEGVCRSELEQLAIALGVQDKIELPGVKKNVIELIKSAKLFVLTSQYEGMSNALCEALCLGLPCISTKVSGSVDLIKDGENGFLVDVDDVEAIENTMSQIVEDEILANRIGESACEVYNSLNTETISEQWVKLLKL